MENKSKTVTYHVLIDILIIDFGEVTTWAVAPSQVAWNQIIDYLLVTRHPLSDGS